MTTNPFPPQAYTRETLVKAYQWLQNQSAPIKELATTPDLLVSLYVKAKTQGNDFLDRPSLKNFKSELKSLAGMMGEFDNTEVTAPGVPGVSSAGVQNLPPVAPKPTAPPVYAPPAQTASAPSQAQAGQPQAQTPQSHAQQNSSIGTSMQPQLLAQNGMTGLNLDPKSQVILQEVKASLNLSSEAEALRLLIAVGHKNIKSLGV